MGLRIRPAGRALGAACLLAPLLHAQPFAIEPARPDIDRWMYPFNSTPGSRPTAAVFSTFGDEAGVDTRHGQFILAWDPPLTRGLAPSRYLLRRARLSVVVARGDVFLHDPSPDPFEAFLLPDHPDRIPDPDPGTPLELFGTGFRNGFTPASFASNSPFGGAVAGRRNAFAAGFAPDGSLVDVGNNLGKTNPIFPNFRTRPFATGDIAGLDAGAPVPAGARIDFELDLGDPHVLGYLREALASGRLWLTITWLGGSEGFVGAPTFPELATAENLIHDPPRLLLEGTVERPEDTDADGLPDDWERFHFNTLAARPEEDMDLDGAGNLEEWGAGTVPTRPDALRLDLLTPSPVRLRWPALANHTDSVESSTNLTDWIPVGGAADHTETGWIHWSDTNAPGPDVLAYRIRRTTTP